MKHWFQHTLNPDPKQPTAFRYALLARLLHAWAQQREGQHIDTTRWAALRGCMDTLTDSSSHDDIKWSMVPLLARNAEEQTALYALFAQCLQETEALFGIHTEEKNTKLYGEATKANSATASPTQLPPVPAHRPTDPQRKVVAISRDLPRHQRPPFVWNIVLPAHTQTEWMPPKAMAVMAQAMRQRELTEHMVLDIPQTIQKTVKQAGIPTLCYAPRTRPVDYLMLIERQHTRDHHAQVWNDLYKALRHEQVDIARYFYRQDPRVCHAEANDMHGRYLSSIQKHHADDRLLMIGRPDSLLNARTGLPDHWTRLIAQWDKRVLLLPLPVLEWRGIEQQLSALMPVLPATVQGLLYYLHELNYKELPDYKQWRQQVQDYPLVPTQPDDQDPIALLAQLYSPQEVLWIATCAIYPTLHYPMTLWLAQQISLPSPMTRLLRLTRLPWLRVGSIPTHVRQKLIAWLRSHHEAEYRRICAAQIAILNQNTPPENSAAWDDMQMHVAFVQWQLADPTQRQTHEDRITELLKNGAEPDFMHLQYADHNSTDIGFEIPEAWRKYFNIPDTDTPDTRTPAAPNYLKPTMVLVAGGTFIMGSTDQDKDADADEKPAHEVSLDSYQIGKYPVTVAEYLAFCEAENKYWPEWLEKGSKYHILTGTDSHYKNKGYEHAETREKLPIMGVSWDDAVTYCQWLSHKTGKVYRLPTEAEWEYAARGGSKSQNFSYAGSNNVDDVAWYDKNSGGKPQPVGEKKPNELGIHDMSGNVWEWCSDWWGKYQKEAQSNPQGSKGGSYRVHRGGSWYNYPRRCRPASRLNNTPTYRGSFLGFRLVSPP